MEKELNELKILTSMESFPTASVDSEKSLHTSSRSSSSVQQSEVTSNQTIELGEESAKSIKHNGHKGLSLKKCRTIMTSGYTVRLKVKRREVEQLEQSE